MPLGSHIEPVDLRKQAFVHGLLVSLPNQSFVRHILAGLPYGLYTLVSTVGEGIVCTPFKCELEDMLGKGIGPWEQHARSQPECISWVVSFYTSGRLALSWRGDKWRDSTWH